MATALEPRTDDAMNTDDKKRRLEDGDSTDDEDFTKVSKRKDQKATPPGATGTKPKLSIDLEAPPKFKVIASSPKEAYKQLKDLEGQRQSLKIRAKPNLAGEWIITPCDVRTLEFMRTTTTLRLQELRP